MKIYDISQEVFSCQIYPGDPRPQRGEDMRISRGDLYNLSSFSMGAHNGTHVDAPFHFLEGGATVEQIPLEKTVGFCLVTEQNSDLTAEVAKNICAERVLIKGCGVVTAEAAQVFADCGVQLVGVEGLSVGPADAPMEVHRILLEAGAVLLEGLRLDAVAEGEYFLCAQPLALAGCDGAPCRAILIETEKR